MRAFTPLSFLIPLRFDTFLPGFGVGTQEINKLLLAETFDGILTAGFGHFPIQGLHLHTCAKLHVVIIF